MIYTMAGPANTIDGKSVFRAVGTYINWEVIGINPNVIVDNCARVKGRFVPHKGLLHKEPAAIVAYGNSLKATWPEVRDFKTVFTCSGSHKFLLDRGIVPTYQVDSDPRTHKVTMLGTPHPDVTYLVASICHPTYFDLLEKHEIPNVLLWHLLFLEPEIYALLPSNEWLWTGGNTVGPRAMKMAWLSGYTNLHFFGFDASTGYAAFHPNDPPVQPYEYDGKTYLTTSYWRDHATMMFEDLDRMPEVQYQFHGEGLIQAMARRYVRTPRAKAPMGVIKGCQPNPVYQVLRGQNGSQ
jgi:hypothetical protein